MYRWLPHNYPNNCVVYTGTHDNETLAGWLSGLKPEELALVRTYLDDHHTPVEQLHRKLVRLAMYSCAKTCIVPVQDWLGLDNTCRTNQPSTLGTNWRWKVSEEQLSDELKEEIRIFTKRYGRMNWDAQK